MNEETLRKEVRKPVRGRGVITIEPATLKDIRIAEKFLPMPGGDVVSFHRLDGQLVMRHAPRRTYYRKAKVNTGRKCYLVGLAEVSNVYGGPEEGGWYYDAGTPVEGTQKKFFNHNSAMKYRHHLQDKIEKGSAFPGVGVGGCGDDDGEMVGSRHGDGLEAVTQVGYGPRARLEGWPDGRPHYE